MTALLEAPTTAPATVAPDFGPLWRRALVRAALAPIPVLAPIIAMAPTADHLEDFIGKALTGLPLF